MKYAPADSMDWRQSVLELARFGDITEYGEHLVQPCDTEDLEDILAIAYEANGPRAFFDPSQGSDQNAKSGTVDEPHTFEVDYDINAAIFDVLHERLFETRGRVDVDFTGEVKDTNVVNMFAADIQFHFSASRFPYRTRVES